MKLYLTYGVGEGLTKKAAFDASLFDVGIANYNLIKLSSVIPENSDIIIRKIDWNNKEYGYKLYVVLAKSIGNGQVSSGIGWIQDKSRKGLFVEEGGKDGKEIKKLIEAALKSMIKYRKGKYGKIKTKIISFKGKQKYSCSVVAVVYKSERW